MPRRKLDQIVVVDVEAACWQGEPPPGQEKEIIKIGMCFLDVASGDRLNCQSILAPSAIDGEFLLHTDDGP